MKRILIIVYLSALSCWAFAGSDDVKLFSLYPVPLKSNRLFVKLNTFGTGIASVELRNLIGRKIQEKQFPPTGDEIFFEEMDANPNGVYVVVAKNAQGKVIEISKFVLNL